VASTRRRAALLVPQRAVSELQGIYNVAVVKARRHGRDCAWSSRPSAIGTLWVIDQGCRPAIASWSRAAEGRAGLKVKRQVTTSDEATAPPRRRPAGGRGDEVGAMASFFIRRPIVAIVISIIIVLLGLNSLRGSSFEQYPFLRPPTIRVTATYPGASAVAVEQSVATPIEQEVNGVEGMIYMKSSNTSDGRMQLDVNFQVGHQQDMANVLTQNRVSSAQARLPQEVVSRASRSRSRAPAS
jgi:hypothetical protein